MIARTRIKICGITRPEDGLEAAQLGADAIGLVFYPGSSRCVDITVAKRIIQALPPFVTPVGLFMDAEAETVVQTIQQLPFGMLQFHGKEEPDYCESFGLPFVKAVPMAEAVDVSVYETRFQAAAGLLLDSHGWGKIGGSGQCFDWGLIPENRHKPIIMAGGLDADNVIQAILHFRPFGVDVSSAVESAKGVKSAALMAAFITAVASAEEHAGRIGLNNELV